MLETNSVNEAVQSQSEELSISEKHDRFIISKDDPILVTGAAGFIGSCVVEALLDRGFHRLVCFIRPSSEIARLDSIVKRHPNGAKVDIIEGNLLSRQDCEIASKDVALTLHLAAGTGEKSFPDAFMNSVVATRNLLDANRRFGCLRRFVLVSSFAVYTNRRKPRRGLLDESCPVEERPELRGDAYCFAKVKQEQFVLDYAKNFEIPYVVVRPGSVYGAGKDEIVGRVGISTFGFFLHLGGSNPIPFTYVDNCAEAIVLAGLVKGVDGEIFNVVDDAPPSSRQFLRLYKKKVRRFPSLYVPNVASYCLSYLWEEYSKWSEGQLPPVFNRHRWHANWKKTRYTNEKLKTRLGWVQKVPTSEGLQRFFQGCAKSRRDA